jgi:hypothetical protein
MSPIGDNVGITAAMALGERLSQGSMNVKHTAGAAGAKAYDFEDIERFFEMPKSHTLFANVFEKDGRVKDVKDGPAGGVYIHTDAGEEVYAPDRESVRVQVGGAVEAGDVASRGIPNPQLIAKYKGIGEARKQFVGHVREVTGNAVSRRNAEVLARAMVSHVRVNAPSMNGFIVGDLAKYDDLVRDYKPRQDAAMTGLPESNGKYLEQPLLHYTIGTRVTGSLVNDLKRKGVKNILVHNEPPDFEPAVQRMLAHSQADPDWMTQLGGYKLSTTFPAAVHRGAVSDKHSTSYMPALARGVEFGKSVETSGLY